MMRTSYKMVALFLVCIFLIGCTPAAPGTVDENPREAPQGKVCNSYDSYLKYVQEAPLPQDFVYYDSIRHFGNFDGFYGDLELHPAYVELGYTKNAYYYYFMDDSAGFKTMFTAQEGKPINPYNAVVLTDSDITPSDMRYVETEHDLCVYIIHGIHYFYGIGELMHIQWLENDTLYSISQADGYLCEHPLDDTGVGQLLNIKGKSETELRTLIGMNR